MDVVPNPKLPQNIARIMPEVATGTLTVKIANNYYSNACITEVPRDQSYFFSKFIESKKLDRLKNFDSSGILHDKVFKINSNI